MLRRTGFGVVVLAVMGQACGGKLNGAPGASEGTRDGSGADDAALDASVTAAEAAYTGPATTMVGIDSSGGGIQDAGAADPQQYTAASCNPDASPWLPPPPCPATLCGNGKLDTCATDGVPAFELCDGVLFASDACLQKCLESPEGGAPANLDQCRALCANAPPASCAGFGYAGGNLACAPDCTVDARGCSPCSTDARVSMCGLVNTQFPPLALASAATASEIGVAWADGDGSGVVHFTRLGLDLKVLSDSACGLAYAYPLFPGPLSASGLSLAPTATGWLMAVTLVGGYTLAKLDGSGVLQISRGLATFDAGGGPMAQAQARVAGGPLGGGLVAWQTPDGTLQLEQVDSNGVSLGPDATIGTVTNWSIVGVDDGFVIAASHCPPLGGGSIDIFHLPVGGAPMLASTIDDQPNGVGSPGCLGNGVSLLSNGVDLRVAFGALLRDLGAQNGECLQGVSAGGVAVGSSDCLAGSPTPALLASDESVIGLNTLDDSLVRWTAGDAGIIQSAPLARPIVGADLGLGIQIIEQGGDAIVVSVDDPTIGSGIIGPLRLVLQRVRVTP